MHNCGGNAADDDLVAKGSVTGPSTARSAAGARITLLMGLIGGATIPEIPEYPLVRVPADDQIEIAT